MRCVGVAAVLVLAFVGLTVVGGVLLLRGGISARAEPLRVRGADRAHAAELGDPLGGARGERTRSRRARGVLAAGLAHFADHCATCHANDGSGQTAIGRKLYPRAPDMRGPATQRLTDGELFYIIENGVRLTGMPAWGGPGTAEGSWHLVHFIRHLPKLTAEEKAQMEALNPKSPDEWRALQDEDAFLRGEEPARP